MNLKILISGVSGDLGKAIALSLEDKYEVVGLYHRNKPEDLNKIQLVQVDFTNPETYQQTISKMRGNLVYIHAAALSRDSLLIHEKSLNTKAALDVNLISAIEISKSLMPNMIKQNFGKFLFLSSVVATRPQIGASSYSISKLGLNSLCKSICVEYGNFGVRANILQLGYFNAGLGARLDENKKNQLLKRIPLRRFGEIRDVVGAVNFIIDNEYLSGSVITLDGGFHVT
jgi:3-oxoacyl-[acyl-carrier protein] reductase